ncbi:flagellin [Terriglobus sp. TAA 43]|uniref:flagellin N-terminal helical domain-containing protein n=1 Tax=Terriglobus sp. TAA 43 TaxID=278961 RepID=UPI000648D6D5|nr:flagellin [Terriglobus sp. TAA 43]
MLNSTTSLQQMLSSLSNLSDQQTRISQEMSSGLRITSLGDDPVASGQAVIMADTLRQDGAFLSTASNATNRMQAADTALGSVVSQLTSAISTATGALNDTGNATTRNISAQSLAAIRDSILSLANSSYGGAYLFSGSSAAVPFSEDASGNVTYTGNQDITSVALTSGGSVNTSLPGSSVFTASGTSVFDALNNIITALQSGTTTNATSLVSGLRDALNGVISQRSVLNSAQSRLSGESDYITAQKTNVLAQQSTLLSADTPTLATELSAVTTQRSALLSTIAAMQKGSLFDYL